MPNDHRDDLSGSYGIVINQINCDGDFSVSKFSDLGDSWEQPAECPACHRTVYFTKETVNRLIQCECGAKLQIQIPEHLL